MREIKNFSFSINVSVEAYKTKEEAGKCLIEKVAKAVGKNTMAFRESVVTVSDFLNLAISGHAFCALFDYNPDVRYWYEKSNGKHYESYPVHRRNKVNKGAMKVITKSDQFFRGAQAIFVDVDYTRFLDVQDYINVLTYKPTCVYMSFSDNIDKGGVRSRRFRLVYVFDRVLDTNEFIWVSSAITRQIEQDTNEPMQDKCGERRSQYMNGVYGNPEIYKTDFIYSETDFPEPPPPQPVVIQPEIPVAASPPQIVFDDKLVYEMEHLSYEAFMHSYSWMGYVYRTEKPEWIDDTYQMTDENYLQIWFCREKVTDGNHRRSKLFKNACLRRLIDPEMNPDKALFNLYVDFVRFFDNSDGVITPDTLKDKVRRAFELSDEELMSFCEPEINYWHKNRPQYILRKIYGVDNRATAKSVQGYITYNYLDSVYNPNMSVQDNAEVIKNVSDKTLYRYVKDRGIETNPNKTLSVRAKRAADKREKEEEIELFKQLYCPDLSISKNMELLKESGLELSRSRVHEWKQKYIENVPTGEQPSMPSETINAPFSIPVPQVDMNWGFGSWKSEQGNCSLF